MKWYKVADHGDTFNGQLLKQRRSEMARALGELRGQAALGGPADVMPRWKGELRRKIMMLPAVDRVYAMSLSEVMEVVSAVSEIKALMSKYSESRAREIMGR